MAIFLGLSSVLVSKEKLLECNDRVNPSRSTIEAAFRRYERLRAANPNIAEMEQMAFELKDTLREIGGLA